MVIYKILRPQEWAEFEKQGVFNGSVDDQRDGFIHFSTRKQMAGTLAKHYNNEEEVVIAGVNADVFDDGLKWEVSRGGAHFPHLYAALSHSAVSSVWIIKQNADGFDLAALDEDA